MAGAERDAVRGRVDQPGAGGAPDPETGVAGGALHDYIVVGSGAGGGPVAARLAEAGFSVLLLEAGERVDCPHYDVPAFHAFASEDPNMRWDYFVRHYGDEGRSRADPKFVAAEDGVLYPRAATLGGCTAHHAMITVYPHNSDWDHIAAITGDRSWSARRMRRYFQRLERKEYRLWERLVYRLIGWNIGRHGYSGWLPSSMSPPALLLCSPRLLRIVLAAAYKAIYGLPMRRAGWLLTGLRALVAIHDVNRFARFRSPRGVRLIPVSISKARRAGARERIERAAGNYPDRLHVQTNALVVELLFDPEQPLKVVGVRYAVGSGLYGATAVERRLGAEQRATVPTVEARCTGEVILAAGAFNTPQLLMLSGIGPRAELERHGLPVRLDRPGVGRNLQDRYEICVVSRMRERFALLDGASYRAPGPGEAPDPLYARWLDGEGPYATNGSVLSVILKSDKSRKEPDLFCFGLIGNFQGYYPGYSEDATRDPAFAWAILKAHTENRGGVVALRSSDPFDPPQINFRYFEEGSGDAQRDLDAVVAGVKVCRRLNETYADLVKEELAPGPDVQTDEEIARYVRDNAWGHHASCSCAMGRPSDLEAVVDSRFRVIGVEALRIVDASIFPRIPGFFIVTAIYMIAEKAAEQIIADRGNATDEPGEEVSIPQKNASAVDRDVVVTPLVPSASRHS